MDRVLGWVGEQVDRGMDEWLNECMRDGWIDGRVTQKVCSVGGEAERPSRRELLARALVSGEGSEGQSWPRWAGRLQEHPVPSLTTNLVHVLQGQAQGLVRGACGGQDGVQGLQQGHATGVPFLTLHFPALEPRHLGRKQARIAW